MGIRMNFILNFEDELGMEIRFFSSSTTDSHLKYIYIYNFLSENINLNSKRSEKIKKY